MTSSRQSITALKQQSLDVTSPLFSAYELRIFYPMHTNPNSKNPADAKYWAFLSYSHQDNLETRKDGGRGYIRWAEWLHGELETYHVPAEFRDRPTAAGELIPERFFPVFQDEKELPINADLAQSIRTALDQSRFLIVICSPRAAASRYVNEEVRYFKQLGREDRIFTLMIDGEPNASFGNKEGNTAADECFCPALLHQLNELGEVDTTLATREEPIAGDVRVKVETAPREAMQHDLRTHRPVLEYMRLKLIAGLMGVGFDELVQRDKARALDEARAKARRARILATAFAGLGLLAVGAAGFAWMQRGVAQRNAGIAAKNERQATENADKARRTLSGSDFFRADELIAADKPPEAMAFLARAIRVDPQNHAAARRALMLLQEQPWFLPEKWMVPAQFRIEDVKFLDCRHAIFMVSDETGIGFCDETGRLLYPMRAQDPMRAQELGEVRGLSEDGQLYFTKVSGEPRHYWDVRDGSPRPVPTKARDSAASAAQREELAKIYQLPPEESENILFSPLGTKAAITLSDLLVVAEFSPPHESMFEQESSSILAFDPITEALVQVGGTTGEFGHSGVVSIPERKKRFRLAEQCMAVRFFPTGRLFVTEQLRGRIHLWDSEGGSFGEVAPASESTWEHINEQYALDVTADGRSIITNGCRLRAIGRRPITLRAEDNPSDHELKDLQQADRDDPLLDVPVPQVELDGSPLKTPLPPEPITVWRRKANLTVTLKASEGYDSAELIAGSVVGARSADGAAGIWDSTSGRRLTQFNVGAGGHILASAANHVLVEFADGCDLWRLNPPQRVGHRLQVADPYNCDVHPDGKRVLICSMDSGVQLFDTTTGEPIGDRFNTSMRFTNVRFSPDGSYFVTESDDSGSGYIEYQLWDTTTQRPINKPIWSNEILAHAAVDGSRAYFGRNGRIYLCARAEEEAPADIYLALDIPPNTAPVPHWLAGFLEAVCGQRVADSNALVTIPTDERRRRIAATREQVAKAESTDLFAAIVRWWLDEDEGTMVSPRSSQSVKNYVEKRLAAGTMLDLALAAHAAPENAMVFAKISALHQAEATGENADESQARADYYSQLARKLDPTSVPPEEIAPARTNTTPPATPDSEAATDFSQAEELRRLKSTFDAESLALYYRAAQRGHAAAMHRIGVAYALGQGVEKDDALAAEWYSKSAEAGFAEAQYVLGVRYILGRGVPKDEQYGVELYRKAAAQGYQDAIDALKKRASTTK